MTCGAHRDKQGLLRAFTLPRIFLLDHFDSFTHNVLHGLVQAGAQVELRRVDQTDLSAIHHFAPDLLVLSPGPGRPEDARLALEVIREFGNRIPILGICLGMQVLAIAFGGMVDRAPEPVHGKVSLVHHQGTGLFEGLPSPLQAGRYHSLRVTKVPECMDVTAHTEDGLVMGLRHQTLPLAGVQFHPDSFLTEQGTEMLTHAVHGNL